MILGIDSSLGTAVAVVSSDGSVRAERSSENPLGHAEVVGGLLEEALAAGGDEQITAVATGIGPGPFTGLRVGIAAGRAFALGRGIPAHAVPSHDAAALTVLLAEPGAARFAIVTDARRREFAFSVYDGLDADGLPIRVSGPELAPRDDLDARLDERAAARRDVAEISAAAIALVAARAVAAGRALPEGEPLYLRAPDVTVRPARPGPCLRQTREGRNDAARAATAADLDAIMALERTSFVSDAWSEAIMAAELDSPHTRYLVAERDGILLGYGGVRAVRGSADADVQTIAVARAARGQGLGRILLRALLEVAATEGAREMFLDVRDDNEVARALYTSEGFVEVGRRPRYYQPDDVDAIVMTLDLRAWGARVAGTVSAR